MQVTTGVRQQRNSSLLVNRQQANHKLHPQIGQLTLKLLCMCLCMHCGIPQLYFNNDFVKHDTAQQHTEFWE